MTINELFEISIRRTLRWHAGGINEWSPLEWAGAMCGEAGEAANAAKKLKRVELKMLNRNSPGRTITQVDEARDKICKEVADTILYGLMLMKAVGCENPEEVIRGVFNRKSEQYGFPERI